MKERPKFFLVDNKISHDSESFDYIVELHAYLWRFICAVYPGANGSLSDFLDRAIQKLEQAQLAKVDKEEQESDAMMAKIAKSNAVGMGLIDKCPDCGAELARPDREKLKRIIKPYCAALYPDGCKSDGANLSCKDCNSKADQILATCRGKRAGRDMEIRVAELICEDCDHQGDKAFPCLKKLPCVYAEGLADQIIALMEGK